MENSNLKMESVSGSSSFIDEHVRKKLEAVLAEQGFPSASSNNSMTTLSRPLSVLWRPNNYRRKIDVKKKDNSTIRKILSAIPSANCNSHTKIVSVHDYQGCTLQYGLDTLTAIWSQKFIDGEKQVYCISARSVEDIQERISQRVNDIELILDAALDSFIKEFDLKLQFVHPVWDRYEDWIKGEEFVDSLPKRCIIHDTVFKKVYGDGVEFKQSDKKEAPGMFVKNYLKNRVDEGFISKELGEVVSIFNQALMDLKHDAIDPLKEQIVTHLEVQHKTLEVHEKNLTIQDKISAALDRFGNNQIIPQNVSSQSSNESLKQDVKPTLGVSVRSISSNDSSLVEVSESHIRSPSFPLPETISFYDMKDRSKSYRSMKASIVRGEFGW